MNKWLDNLFITHRLITEYATYRRTTCDLVFIFTDTQKTWIMSGITLESVKITETSGSQTIQKQRSFNFIKTRSIKWQEQCSAKNTVAQVLKPKPEKLNSVSRKAFRLDRRDLISRFFVAGLNSVWCKTYTPAPVSGAVSHLQKFSIDCTITKQGLRWLPIIRPTAGLLP